jgi:arsenite methyltransferase
MPEHDKRSRWLLETRFGGDEKAAAISLGFLTKVRDRLLDKAGLANGKTVLDVGAGDGLIAFLRKTQPRRHSGKNVFTA